ncbi:MAG: hypothetical protein ACXVWU_07995 [Nocardioides sp.]
MNNRAPWLRLLLETTFTPLFLGILAALQALKVSDDLWHDVLSVAAAFLISLCCFRRFDELNLRQHRPHDPSRPSGATPSPNRAGSARDPQSR